MQIFLIGMPGSGKTSLGKQLERKIDLPFYDLDDVIEEKEGMNIGAIFEKHGETYFREIEHVVLFEFCSANRGTFIMATGGGTPCFSNNMELMNASGKTVYLKVGPGELAKRLRDEPEKRPLLKGATNLFENLSRMLEDRKECYSKSNVTLEADNMTVDGLITALINAKM